MKVCSVEGCGRKHHGNGFCGKHNNSFKKHGTAELPSELKKYGIKSRKYGVIELAGGKTAARTLNGSGYFLYRDKGKIRYEHIMVAEKALGRPLPSGTEIHHVDGNRANNDPRNLVICPSQAYHSLIEARTRAYEKCGNPNWKECWVCKNYDSLENMVKGRSKKWGNYQHKECLLKYERDRRKRKLLSANTPK